VLFLICDIAIHVLAINPCSGHSLAELEKEMTGLKSGLVQINAEVEFQRRQALVVGDRYLSVTREFLSTAGGKVESLEKLFSEMKWKVRTTHI